MFDHYSTMVWHLFCNVLQMFDHCSTIVWQLFCNRFGSESSTQDLTPVCCWFPIGALLERHQAVTVIRGGERAGGSLHFDESSRQDRKPSFCWFPIELFQSGIKPRRRSVVVFGRGEICISMESNFWDLNLARRIGNQFFIGFRLGSFRAASTREYDPWW